MTFVDQQTMFNRSVIDFLHPNLQRRNATKSTD
jgi:hypothetical protein